MRKEVFWDLVLGAMLALFLSLGGIPTFPTQSATYPCHPEPEVAAGLAKLDVPVDVEHTTTAERRDRARAILQSLLAEYPDNLFVHRRYQRFFMSSPDADPAALIERYKGLLGKHPDNPIYLDLYGYALAGYHTREAEQEFQKALSLACNFPWPHLDLATKVYGTPAFNDPAKFQTNLEDFMNACPLSLEAFSQLGRVNDTAFLRASAQQLRDLLRQQTDEQDVRYYSTLWNLESRVTPPGQTGILKKQVAADIAGLRALKMEKSSSGYSTLARGYKLLGDQEGQRWVQAEELKNLPNAPETISAIIGEWYNKHPWPGSSASPQQKKAYYGSLLEVSSDWTQRWPNFAYGWNSRFDALSQMQDAPLAELESAADGLLRAAARNPDLFFTTPPFSITVAEAYVKRGIRLESVPSLVSDGLKDFAKRNRRNAESDTAPPELAKILKYQPGFVQWEGLITLVDAYIKMKQPTKAHEALAQMESFLGQHTLGKSATTVEKNMYLARSKDYWNRMGQLAELENHKLDALAYYQTALQYLAQLPDRNKKDDKTATQAKQLWNAMGGTVEGWQAWLSRLPLYSSAQTMAPNIWDTIDQPLPDFDLTDVRGTTWRLADIKGKVTFIDVWATWCGPCRAELPFVQKLYNQVKSQGGVRVLTLNDDENPGLARQFMAEHHYDFPAALAYSYLNSTVPDIILPRNWIVDRDGVRRLQALGFGSDGNEWSKEVRLGIAQFEK